MAQKTTDKLREGDIVLHGGMRILIDGPVTVYPDTSAVHDRYDTYVWPGLVLNANELCDKDSPEYDGWIASFLRGQQWEDRMPRPRKDDWPIKGNKLANWYTEES